MQDYTEQQIEDKINPPKPLLVRFYQKPIISEVSNGVNIYKAREMVEIKVQGENGTSLSKVATDRHRHEHSDAYKLFQSRLIEGLTPLCAITDLMTAQSLIDMGIKSVDELAVADPLPLFDHLRKQAKQLLDIKNDTYQDRREHNSNKERVQRPIEESSNEARDEQGLNQDRCEHVRGEKEESNQKESFQIGLIQDFSYSI